MTCMGKGITTYVLAMVNEEILHHDVNAWGAPSECHDLVARGEAQRLRLARRRAARQAGVNVRTFMRAFKALPQRHHNRLLLVLEAKHDPFYGRKA